MDPTNPEDITRMVTQYADTALWSSLGGPEGETSLDDLYGRKDFTAEAWANMRADCEAFAYYNASDIERMEPESVGHDFWLTRNRHGAGFWDRGNDPKWQRLTNAAHVYGTSDIIETGGMLEVV